MQFFEDNDYIEFSPEALRAIQNGVEAGDPVTNLEWLGLAPRALQQLNEAEIITFKHLMSKRQEDLLEIDSFGGVSLDQLLEALSQYHNLEEASQLHIDPKIRNRIKVLRRLNG